MNTEPTTEQVEQAMAAEKAESILGHYLITAIINRRPFEGHQLISYITSGGTYVIASAPKWNDGGVMRDLAAIGRLGDVVALSPTAAPEFIEALRVVVAAS